MYIQCRLFFAHCWYIGHLFLLSFFPRSLFLQGQLNHGETPQLILPQQIASQTQLPQQIVQAVDPSTGAVINQPTNLYTYQNQFYQLPQYYTEIELTTEAPTTQKPKKKKNKKNTKQLSQLPERLQLAINENGRNQGVVNGNAVRSNGNDKLNNRNAKLVKQNPQLGNSQFNRNFPNGNFKQTNGNVRQINGNNNPINHFNNNQFNNQLNNQQLINNRQLNNGQLTKSQFHNNQLNMQNSRLYNLRQLNNGQFNMQFNPQINNGRYNNGQINQQINQQQINQQQISQQRINYQQINPHQINQQQINQQRINQQQFNRQQINQKQINQQKINHQQINNGQFNNNHFNNKQINNQQINGQFNNNNNRQIFKQQLDNPQLNNQQYNNQQYSNQQYKNQQFKNQQTNNSQHQPNNQANIQLYNQPYNPVNSQPTSSNNQPTLSNNQPTSFNNQRTLSNNQPNQVNNIANNQPNSTNNQHNLPNNQPNSGYNYAPLTNNQLRLPTSSTNYPRLNQQTPKIASVVQEVDVNSLLKNKNSQKLEPIQTQPQQLSLLSNLQELPDELKQVLLAKENSDLLEKLELFTSGKADPTSLEPYRGHPLFHFLNDRNTIQTDKIISFRSPQNDPSDTTTLILKPVARALAGEEGRAVATPVSRAVLRKGANVDILFEPDAVAIAGARGIAHAQSDLDIVYDDMEDGSGDNEELEDEAEVIDAKQ